MWTINYYFDSAVFTPHRIRVAAALGLTLILPCLMYNVGPNVRDYVMVLLPFYTILMMDM